MKKNGKNHLLIIAEMSIHSPLSKSAEIEYDKILTWSIGENEGNVNTFKATLL